jgi:hypothetical protein
MIPKGGIPMPVRQELKEEEIRWLKHLFYEADMQEMIREAETCEDPLILHAIADNYNWDDGFEVPTAIMRNPNCDLGTALMLFDLSEGWELLAQPEPDLEDWRREGSDWEREWRFVAELYGRIIRGEFASQEISYDPGLNRVQLYKWRKYCPWVPDLFLEKSPGVELKLPLI